MAQAVPSVPGAADGASGDQVARRRAPDSRYVWSAPSPSPAEVADLELRFPDIVQVPSDALEEEAIRWEKNAIITRSINCWVPPDTIIREFRRGGVPGEVEAVSLTHRCIKFRFSDFTAKSMVLDRPWVANGQPIATEVWSSEFISVGELCSFRPALDPLAPTTNGILDRRHPSIHRPPGWRIPLL